jgi:hypothetical protein
VKPAPLSGPVGIRRMVTLCAWCPESIRLAQAAAVHRMGYCVTHGVCPECAARLRGEAAEAARVKSAIVRVGTSLGEAPGPGAITFLGVERP